MPRLAEVASINPKLDRASLQADDLASFVPMASVSEQLGAVTHEEVRPAQALTKGFTPFLDRDVLVAKITPCFENGKIAHARIGQKWGFGSTEFHVLRPNADKLDDRYLYHFMRQPRIREEGELRMTGSAGQRRVPRAFLEELDVPLPPLPEQRRIAAILDKADALRAKRRQAIAKLEQLGMASFSSIFKDALSNSRRDALRDQVDEFRYGTSAKSTIEGWPTLRIPNVASGALDLDDLKTVPVTAAEFERLRLNEGDVLFVRTNGNPDYVGRCAVFEQDAVASAGYEPDKFIYASYLIRARLRPGGVAPFVLQHYLSSPEGRRAIRSECKTSAGQYNINTEGLGSIKIPRFPQEQQIEFLRAFKSLMSRMGSQVSALSTTEKLFFALQHHAFAGSL